MKLEDLCSVLSKDVHIKLYEGNTIATSDFLGTFPSYSKLLWLLKTRNVLRVKTIDDKTVRVYIASIKEEVGE